MTRRSSSQDWLSSRNTRMKKAIHGLMNATPTGYDPVNRKSQASEST
jgi:hypothetical protein